MNYPPSTVFASSMTQGNLYIGLAYSSVPSTLLTDFTSDGSQAAMIISSYRTTSMGGFPEDRTTKEDSIAAGLTTATVPNTELNDK